MITKEEIREGLLGFLGNVFSIENTSKGYAVAMPALMADGWQVTFLVEQVAADTILLSDAGRTISWLEMRGINSQSDIVSSLFHEKVLMFQAECPDGVLKKLTTPQNLFLDMQLFAELIASLSHLIFRFNPSVANQRTAYQCVDELVVGLGLPCDRKAHLKAASGRDLVVDFCVSRSGLPSRLLQTVDARTKSEDLIEIWGYRLNDIVDFYQEVCAAIIYNEDFCHPKPFLHEIMNSRKGKLFPYHRQDEIADFLKTA